MESVEHTSIVTKGRRTKRQRSAITSAASSTGGGGGGGFGFEINNYSSSTTTASASASGNHSDDQDVMSEITTEEEDMANCLIMLARGTTTAATAAAAVDRLPISDNKFECKTCNKIFHSFQALGGHRASHKRPKPILTEIPIPSPSPILIVNQKQQTKVNNDSKVAPVIRVHECSICGSEFPSGQALGGHMRRHRAPPVRQIQSSGPLQIRTVLPLDLNLPAPGDDDDHHKIEQESLDQNIKTTAFHRVLPTPALVDCHY